MSLPYGEGMDARMGIGAMERSSDQAFSGFLFSLWRKGTAQELPWEEQAMRSDDMYQGPGAGAWLLSQAVDFPTLEWFFG